MATPRSTHLHTAKNLLRYLSGTIYLAICFRRLLALEGVIGLLSPVGFANSNFTGDLATLRSTYGYLTKLVSGIVSWKSKRVTIIVLFTTKAETDTLTKAIREVQ